MAATADRDRQTEAAGEVDGDEDIIRIGAVHDQGRIAVHPAVPDATSSLIASITGADHFPSQTCPQLRNGRRFESSVHAHPSLSTLCAKTVRKVSMTWARAARAGGDKAIELSSTRSWI